MALLVETQPDSFAKLNQSAILRQWSKSILKVVSDSLTLLSEIRSF